ncbi:glutamate receptor 2.5-like isoform X1 [Iris pallida]|uniref:Glutamate receptor 2.5-like isoform X1 n=1 Tax=Iris pallida TaxID=29817 RepID=A0AAX6FRV5_IRIPA|nr:glutamate receptor 2.5-like isoform X1 [Iris pallida]
MDRPNLLLYILCLAMFFSSSSPGRMQVVAAESNITTSVNVGVVLDLGSLPGKKNLASMSMAIDDFYTSHRNFSTKVTLHPRDSEKDIVGAASAALYLLKKVQVQAIIGPITSSQAKFVAELGNKTQVPLLSFSATSPSLSSARTPYFVRTTLNDSSQVGAIAAIVESYGWREAVLVYEESEYGCGIIPFLIDAFNSIDTRVPYRCVLPANASDELINMELDKMKAMPTRVFVVHMMSMLGSRLFPLARAGGLMSKGYVWIATDGLTNVLDTMDPNVLGSMEGMLGVQPYIPKSTSLSKFSARWRERFVRDNPSVTVPPTDPTAFQLWAYDTTWALALAAEEEAAKAKYSFRSPPSDNNTSTDLGSLAISENGPQLLAAISSTRFHGISGDFLLVDGQRQSDVYEIVNVVRNGRRSVGFWSPASGITREVDSRNSSNESFKTGVIWPGDVADIPKGWETEKKLVIGVPVKNGFNQFVNVDRDNVTGYCIDVFNAVMNRLEYKVQYVYEPFENSPASYDDLVYQVFLQKYDAVVGDVTILWNRSLYVDFTVPYTESGVSMIVPMQKDESKHMWIFLKPFTTDLWLASLAFFFFTGFVVWVIEHRINKEFRGPPSQQFGTIFYFAFSTLVFAHKERLESNLSRFVVIIWVFVVLILTSSYTASLTSRLTVQQLQPTVADVSELIKSGDYVGYQDGSFVKGLLTRLQFDEKKLKNYSTPDQYSEALLKGTKNGGVAAIFDEIPYLKLFLSGRCADFDMVGRIYKTDGFGFVLPRGSPLVPDVSRAILKVTEGNEMSAIEKKWFGNQITCQGDINDYSSSSLNFRSFGGLFLITGVVSSLALLFFLVAFFYKEWGGLRAAATETSFWKRLVAWYQHYDDKDFKSHTFRNKYPESVNANGTVGFQNEPAAEVLAWPTGFEGSQSPFSVISNMSDMNFGASPEEAMTSTQQNNPPSVVGSPEEVVMASVELSYPHNVVSSQEVKEASLVMSDPPNVVGSAEIVTSAD